MFNTAITPKVYTPEEVANILKLSKNTVYGLINKGQLIAKRIGKVYRIPASSIAFAFTGLDYELYNAEQRDMENLPKIEEELSKARSKL